MYNREFAQVYDLLYTNKKDYRAESAYVADLVRELLPSARTLLDVGCGTGEHLRDWSTQFEVTGVEYSAAMAAVARRKLPGVRIEPGDMRTLDLPGERFDVVCSMYGCVGYLRGVDELRTAVERMAAHCRPGGLFLLEPWISRENWNGGPEITDLTVGEGIRLARMGNWEVNGPRVAVDLHYLFGDATGVRPFQDRQELTLYTEQEYRDAVTASVPDVEFRPGGATGRGIFVGRPAPVPARPA